MVSDSLLPPGVDSISLRSQEPARKSCKAPDYHLKQQSSSRWERGMLGWEDASLPIHLKELLR